MLCSPLCLLLVQTNALCSVHSGGRNISSKMNDNSQYENISYVHHLQIWQNLLPNVAHLMGPICRPISLGRYKRQRDIRRENQIIWRLSFISIC